MPGMCYRVPEPEPESPPSELPLINNIIGMRRHLEEDWLTLTPEQRRFCIQELARFEYELRYGGLRHAH